MEKRSPINTREHWAAAARRGMRMKSSFLTGSRRAPAQSREDARRLRVRSLRLVLIACYLGGNGAHLIPGSASSPLQSVLNFLPRATFTASISCSSGAAAWADEPWQNDMRIAPTALKKACESCELPKTRASYHSRI